MTMKLAVSAALLLGSAAAFAPSAIVAPAFPRVVGGGTALFDTTAVDSSTAIEEALAATEKFGATSPEARIAWEIVEEMDSATSHVKSDSAAAAAAAAAAPAAPEKVVVREESPEYIKAVMEAKVLTEQAKMLSGKARVAWEAVEEIAAAESQGHNS
eukprot:CAMPEP_0172526196 /NCGR_PEP_ID=MMETSP1067-20121228/1149_1 /TAXON_ID=265564 ORGANISM="Thalassiosira punctigera, Strain Tpunct2005C2" /NCGR_SAMPLE_ID=MMETSP1067 /ASSEMBLY_ACC=CAM_ASM_000444 /LENGTH=156 /DNA_ID=CAMNT_0013309645 /DNA_START=40 /DNA_END=510 /DNA_ORIENTATION=+